LPLSPLCCSLSLSLSLSLARICAVVLFFFFHLSLSLGSVSRLSVSALCRSALSPVPGSVPSIQWSPLYHCLLYNRGIADRRTSTEHLSFGHRANLENFRERPAAAAAATAVVVVVVVVVHVLFLNLVREQSDPAATVFHRRALSLFARHADVLFYPKENDSLSLSLSLSLPHETPVFFHLHCITVFDAISIRRSIDVIVNNFVVRVT